LQITIHTIRAFKSKVLFSYNYEFEYVVADRTMDSADGGGSIATVFIQIGLVRNVVNDFCAVYCALTMRSGMGWKS
jgi:hypothetical protein